jgi:hypothetical protein
MTPLNEAEIGVDCNLDMLALARRNQSLDLRRINVTWQRRQAPLWNGRHGLIEPCSAMTVRAEEPQEASQCRDHCFDVGTRDPLRLCDDDLSQETDFGPYAI